MKFDKEKTAKSDKEFFKNKKSRKATKTDFATEKVKGKKRFSDKPIRKDGEKINKKPSKSGKKH